MADLDSFSFGDNAALADELLELVLAGKETATCWAASEGARASRSASDGSSRTATVGRAPSWRRSIWRNSGSGTSMRPLPTRRVKATARSLIGGGLTPTISRAAANFQRT